MPRTLAGLPILALLCVATPAAPVPKDQPKEPAYFPTDVKVGAKWVYRRGDTEFALVVTAIEEKGGEKVVSLGTETSDKVLPYQTLRVSGKGLFQVATGGQELDPPICLLQLPHKNRSKWVTPCVFSTGPTGNRTHTDGTRVAHGPERVEVPAGVFETVRVVADYEFLGKPVQSTAWYAAGVGMIKAAAGDDVMVLKSYTPGRK